MARVPRDRDIDRSFRFSPERDDDVGVLADAFPEVLAAAKLGAEWAWRLLHDELSGPLLRYARVRGAHDPDDVVGEVFLELARRIQSFEGSFPALRGLVFMMASHRVIDEHRRRGRRPEDLVDRMPDHETAATAEDAAVDREAAARAMGLIRELSPDQQEVLVLRLVADLSLEEVAQATGRSLTAVKALQRRGLAALRRKILLEAVSR